jgi:2-haloacid dehalogenase
MDFSGFEYMTFDCYGTLIDWERGIVTAFRPLLEARGARLSDDDVLELYGELESGAQAGSFQPYADVLRLVVDGLGARLGFTPTSAERNALVDSIGDWPAFPDTPASLAALARRYRLYVLSNVDDDLFARTAPQLGVAMDGVITAQQIRSYKPDPLHFTTFLERTGASPDRVVHVAQSLFHDIPPAQSVGMRTVWVNRRGDRSGGGATPASAAKPDMEVPDLATLVRMIEGGG